MGRCICSLDAVFDHIYEHQKLSNIGLNSRGYGHIALLSANYSKGQIESACLLRPFYTSAP